MAHILKKDFLYEVGTEEIPARFLPGAVKQLRSLAGDALKEQLLAYEKLTVYATPRRLVLSVQGLDTVQPDSETEQKGPALKSAYDSEGKPTKALEGFCKGQGISFESLIQKELGGNLYLFAKKHLKGKSATEILPGIMLQLVNKLYFPKPMRWGYEELRFARPIRWLVALLGDEIIPLTIAGINSGRITRGHRVLGSAEINIPEPAQYEQLLLDNWVMVDQEKRRVESWRQIQALAQSLGGQVEEDQELLEEVVYLVEYPTALAGTFEDKYLSIPEELVITPMKEHQRYFPVHQKAGGLMNRFITIRNGDDRFLEIVAEGNGNVLRARLADAEFFWLEDIKEPLSAWESKLDNIVFHEKLGSLGQKSARVRNLGSGLGKALAYTDDELIRVDRAIFLMKADLLSRVVYEFPELQGIIGQYYAEKDGEDPEVAQAIQEHYLPRFAGDDLPESKTGIVASICEKLDSIVGFFAIGIQPTGSQDPYALRRAAAGIVQIIIRNRLELSLSGLITASYNLYAKDRVDLNVSLTETVTVVTGFLGQRLENILNEEGIAYDIVNAIAVVGYDNLFQAYNRAQALFQYSKNTGFAQVLEGFTRAANILKKNSFQAGLVKEELLAENAEKELFATVSIASGKIAAAVGEHRYEDALEIVGSLRDDIDRFFANVMVMTEDEALRLNRLRLLGEVIGLTEELGDLSQIVSR